jgi:hypothetical protein
MADDKILRFKFEVDDNSFNNVKLKIQELKREVEGLARVLSGIQVPGAGGGAAAGGGGLLSAFTSGKGVSGLPSSAGAQGGGNAAVGGVAGILTQGLVADKNLFRTVAEGSKEALRAMKDALKQTADEQGQIIRKLKGELDELGKSYNNLKDYPGEMASGSRTGIENKMVGVGRQLMDANRAKASAEGALSGDDNAGMGGLSRIGRMLGIPAGAGLAMGAAYLGYKAYDTGANAYYDSRQSNLSEYMGAPNRALDIAARTGGSLGGTALGMRNGNMASGIAGVQLWKSDIASRILDSKSRQALGALAEINSGNTYKIGDIMSSVSQGIGAEFTTAISGEPAERHKDIALRIMQQEMNSRLSENMSKGISDWSRVNPRAAEAMNNWRGNVLGDASLLRTIGGGDVKNGQWYNAAANFRANAVASGYDPGEVAGAIRQAGMSVGWANRWKGSRFLRAQSGGLPNAGEIFGMGQQYGNGDDLLGAFIGKGGMGGRGGLDPFATGMVGNMTASGLAGSGYGGDIGGALAQGLGGVTGLGGSVGGQIRMARLMASTGAAANARANGSSDPYQSALNAYAGANAFGGNYQAMQAAGRLTADETSGYLRRGSELPKSLTDTGMSIDSLRKYVDLQNSFGLSRFVPSGQHTGLDKTAAAIRGAGGNPIAYMKQQLQSISDPFQRTSRLKAMMEDVQGVMGASVGDTPASQTGTLGRMMAADPDLVKDMKGGGISWGLSKDSLTKAGLAAEGKKIRNEGQQVKENEGPIRDFLAGGEALTTGLEQLSKIMLSVGADGANFVDLLKGQISTMFSNIKKIDTEKLGAHDTSLRPQRVKPDAFKPQRGNKF